MTTPMGEAMRAAWRRLGEVGMRGCLCLVALVTLSSVVVPAQGAFASEFAPDDEPFLAYSSGIEPGAVLAGRVLPLDWSEREEPCVTDQSRFVLEYRVAPSIRPPLCPGDVSEAVAHLQRLLTEKKLYRDAITGVYDRKTAYAVATFHKIIGPSHSTPATARQEWIADPPPEDWTGEDWELLDAFEPKPPKYRDGQPDRVEVDIGHQVLYLIEDDAVAAIIPVSTGQGRGVTGCQDFGCGALVTPRTDAIEGGSRFYTAHSYVGGWGGLYGIYKGVFYRGNVGEWYYGIHGYRHVPHHPESHGCVRVTTWDMDFLRPSDDIRAPDSRLSIGMTIHVWDA